MSPLVATQVTSAQPAQYLQHHPTRNKVVFVLQVVTVRWDRPVPSNATLESIALTRDYMFRMLTVLLVSTVGWDRNPHDRMIIQQEMHARKELIARKGVTISRFVHPELSRTQRITHELRIASNVPWGAIVLDGVTRILLGYVIRVSIVPKVN